MLELIIMLLRCEQKIFMDPIIIKKKKYNVRAILALITVIFGFLFSLEFLLHPSEYIHFRLRSKEIVIIFSVIGLVSCFIAAFVILKVMFRKNAFLRIDKHGIYDGFSSYDCKFIKWEEIDRIHTINYNYNNYIAIFNTKRLQKEKGINLLFYKMNEFSMGTPYIITSGYLDCSFKELEQFILDAYKKNKRV